MTGFVGNDVISKAAADYARALRNSTVGGLLFPLEMVSDATGKVPRLPRDTLSTVPDSALATSVSPVPRASVTLDTVSYACQKHGYADDVALSDIEKARGAFPEIIRYTLQRIMLQLQMKSEGRVAALLSGVDNSQKVTLAGTGTTAANKWAMGNDWGTSGGQPVEVLAKLSAAMPLPADTLVIPRPVYEKVRFNDDFIGAIPNITYKSLTPEMLASVLQLKQVLVPNVNTRAASNANFADPWGNKVYLLRVGDDKLEPKAGMTLINQYAEGAMEGYIAREYVDETKGIKGVRTYSVTVEIDEILVNPELVRVVEDVT